MIKKDFELYPPYHPGTFLKEELLEPLEITQTRLAEAMNVSYRRVNEIVQGKRNISVDTAKRLGYAFGMSSDFWLNLQRHYDQDMYEQQGFDIEQEVTPLRIAS